MKNFMINIINYLESIRIERPRLFRFLYYSMWAIAPIEMASIKLGLFTYRKIKEYKHENLEKWK